MANTYHRSQDALTAKIVSTAKLEMTSPLLIASGESEHSDKDILLHEDGRPYIPSTSITGMIKALIKKYDRENMLEYFWGTDDSKAENTCQSHFVIDDLQIADNQKLHISERDGVYINSETLTAKDQGKYDYQALESLHSFSLKIEATVREGVEINAIIEEIKKIYSFLQTPLARIGALTTTGFGQFDVKDIRIKIFDFSQDGHSDSWFEYISGEKIDDQEIETIAAVSLPYITVKGKFSLRSSLMTGTYSGNVSAPDKSQLKSDGKFILSGKSLKGAMRHRAVKICNTIGLKTNDIIHSLMGYVDDNKPDSEAIKSRLWIDETLLHGKVKEGRQDRIKIDRWSGAVVGGAKFDSEPVWKKNDTDTFEISMILLPPAGEKQNQAQEVALVLHILKDLWTGDLAVGGEKNVGRGTMKGHELTLEDGEQSMTVKAISDSDALEITDNHNLMSKYNNALNLQTSAA